MPEEDKKLLYKKSVRVEHVYPDGLQSHFVSNIVVQHQPDYFVLSFFEAWLPAILGESDEEKQAAISSVERVEAKCVARLVVTPSKMREFLEVLSENFANYENMIKLLTETKQRE